MNRGIIIPLLLYFILSSFVSYSQISVKDTSDVDWEKFGAIFRLSVVFDRPDTTFSPLPFENGFQNDAKVVVKSSLFPLEYKEHVNTLETLKPQKGQTILFRDYETIGEIKGYLIESEISDEQGVSKVLYFSVPHEFGSINMIARYPKNIDIEYRSKIFKCFGSMRFSLTDIP